MGSCLADVIDSWLINKQLCNAKMVYWLPCFQLLRTQRAFAGVRPPKGKYMRVSDFFWHCPPFVKPAAFSLGGKMNLFWFVK